MVAIVDAATNTQVSMEFSISENFAMISEPGAVIAGLTETKNEEELIS